MRSAARSLISRAEFDPETYCRAPPLPHLDQGICVALVEQHRLRQEGEAVPRLYRQRAPRLMVSACQCPQFFVAV
jgi:hypothetical protein